MTGRREDEEGTKQKTRETEKRRDGRRREEK